MREIKTVQKEDEIYPERLKNTRDAPPFLRYKGDLDGEILEDTLAVVGSRRMTSYGKRATEALVRELAGEGITIVSGFMYGIDATAHRAALEAGGKTVAVMPCGINIVHPSYQKDLYEEIEEKGLILSEFEDDFPPAKWTYPKRNRIVVGLSSATLVVEAAEKSGSLISAELARENKRELFAVPGPIFNKNSQGTNDLIKRGAHLVSCASDILSFFKKDKDTSKEKKKEGLSKEEILILETLNEEPAETDEIKRRTDLPASKVNTLLSLLEIKGFIKKEGRKYFPF